MPKPYRETNPTNSPVELARQKTLCDMLFGAADNNAYARTTGRELAGFTLCLIGLGGAIPCMTDALEWASGLPQCRDAAVFAVSPRQIAILWEWADGAGSRFARPGKLGWLLPAAGQRFGVDAIICTEAARGAGATELWQCYLECNQALSTKLPVADNRSSAYDTARNIGPVLRKAMDYVAAHYTEPLTLEDVAEHTFVSACYVSRLFMRELGMNFIDYLNTLRLEHAKRLLRSTNLKVIEIAELTGISDAHYFARLFKRSTGLSPTEYRVDLKT